MTAPINSLEAVRLDYEYQESTSDYLELISRINTLRDLKELRKKLVFLYFLGLMQLLRSKRRQVERKFGKYEEA